MLEQIRVLTRAQLCNFLNINVVRHSKDKRKKRNMLLLGGVWALLIAMIWFYIGAMAVGYIQIGMGDVLPMYLMMIASLIIFFFGIFKAGSVIFQKDTYEMLCALPVSQTAIVVSRFLGMYFGNLLLVLAVMIPGMAVYAYLLHPEAGFYIWGGLGCVFIPLLPMTAATMIGAVVTAISSRMKHKSLVSSALTILCVVAIMGLSSSLSMMEGEITEQMVQNFSNLITEIIGNICRPAVWLGAAMLYGNVKQGILYFSVSIVVFVLMVIGVSAKFKEICQSLYSTTAKHNYQLQKQRKTGILLALYQKEMKRYFASSIYVTNTIIGPIMMAIMAGGVFAVGKEQIEQYIPIAGGVVRVMPFAMAAIACMMTTTSVSVSMEGKEWWILQSLPISAKAVFDSKILLNLSLIAPFYVISEVLVNIALKPSAIEMFWLIVLPVLFCVFSAVLGITVNLLFPNFEWRNEAYVVKQSAAAFVGGFGGTLTVVICAVPMVFWTNLSANLVRSVIAVMIVGMTLILYRKNESVELSKVETR